MSQMYDAAGGKDFGDRFGLSVNAVTHRLCQHLKNGKLRRQLEQAAQNIQRKLNRATFF